MPPPPPPAAAAALLLCWWRDREVAEGRGKGLQSRTHTHQSFTNHFSVAAEHISLSGAAVIKRDRERERVCLKRERESGQAGRGRCVQQQVRHRLTRTNWQLFHFYYLLGSGWNFGSIFVTTNSKKLTKSAAADHFFQVVGVNSKQRTKKQVHHNPESPPRLTRHASPGVTLDPSCPSASPAAIKKPPRMVCLLLKNHMIE